MADPGKVPELPVSWKPVDQEPGGGLEKAGGAAGGLGHGGLGHGGLGLAMAVIFLAGEMAGVGWRLEAYKTYVNNLKTA